MNKKRANLIFEHFTVFFFPLAFLAKGLGFRILYLNVSPRLSSVPWFVRLQKRWGINKAIEHELDYHTEIYCHYDALQTVEDVYRVNFEKLRVIMIFVRRLNSEKMHLAYKKVLLETLHRFYLAKAALHKISQDLAGEYVVFIPNDSLTIQKWLESAGHGLNAPLIPANIRIPWWGWLYSKIIVLGRALKWIGGFFIFPIWAFSRIRTIQRSPQEKQHFQVGIRAYRTDIAFKFSYRKIDFLLDDKKITKENTLFCVETEISPEYWQELRQRSYHVVDLPNALRSVSFDFFRRILIKDFLMFWFRCWWGIMLTPTFFIKVTLKNWMTYLAWMRFLESYSIRHLVVYNDFGEQHIIRNILLSRDKTQTWYYLHSRNSDDIFAPESQRHRHVYVSFSYLYYDNFIRWSRNIENYYKPHCIQRFLDLGCLWSEHIKLISQRPDFEKIREDYRKKFKVPAQKIIAVFDTSFGFGTGYVLRLEDIILFTEDILRLLDEFPDIQIIFKEKNIRDEVEIECPQILPLYEKLARHQRCYFSGWFTDPSEVNAVADLSITACFSSTTVEALGARKKAIYYDPSGFLKGTYYDKFPNLVAHSYAELKVLVKHYLYEVSEMEFNRWIDTVIIDEVDAFADGQAITRLRDLLTKEE